MSSKGIRAHLPKVIAAARATFDANSKAIMHYAKVELTPPKPSELPEAFRHAGRLIKGLRTGAWKDVALKEALVNSVITMEVLCWFFVGEIIGKRKVIGYRI